MRIKALLFVIFTVFLFALGVLVTTLFNAAPVTPDAVAMFYASLALTIFGLIFFIIFIIVRLQTQITPGLSAIKAMLRQSLVVDILAIALLALKANNVLNWATAIVLTVVALIIGVILKRRKRQ